MGEFLHNHPSQPRTEKELRDLTTRLNRIEGQVRGIKKMIEDDRYCLDILSQLSSVQSALKQVGYMVTERHITHCVSDAIQQGEGEDSVEELLRVMKQLTK